MIKEKTFVLGLGAQRCGTTWLNKCIQSLPEANTGFRKEYHVWDAIHTPGLERFKVSLLEALTSSLARKRLRMQKHPEFYFNYFANLLAKPGINISCDITPSYSSLNAEVFSYIKAEFAKRQINCKFVFLMRDPVDRCWSAVRNNRNKQKSAGGVPLGGTEMDALHSYASSIDCQIRTNYSKTIIELRKAIEPENVYIGVFEETIRPKGIDALAHFLDMPTSAFAQNPTNVSPITEKISANSIAHVAKLYRNEYEFCAKEFPQVLHFWQGYKSLDGYFEAT